MSNIPRRVPKTVPATLENFKKAMGPRYEIFRGMEEGNAIGFLETCDIVQDTNQRNQLIEALRQEKWFGKFNTFKKSLYSSSTK